MNNKNYQLEALNSNSNFITRRSLLLISFAFFFAFFLLPLQSRAQISPNEVKTFFHSEDYTLNISPIPSDAKECQIKIYYSDYQEGELLYQLSSFAPYQYFIQAYTFEPGLYLYYGKCATKNIKRTYKFKGLLKVEEGEEPEYEAEDLILLDLTKTASEYMRKNCQNCRLKEFEEAKISVLEEMQRYLNLYKNPLDQKDVESLAQYYLPDYTKTLQPYYKDLAQGKAKLQVDQNKLLITLDLEKNIPKPLQFPLFEKIMKIVSPNQYTSQKITISTFAEPKDRGRMQNFYSQIEKAREKGVWDEENIKNAITYYNGLAKQGDLPPERKASYGLVGYLLKELQAYNLPLDISKTMREILKNNNEPKPSRKTEDEPNI